MAKDTRIALSESLVKILDGYADSVNLARRTVAEMAIVQYMRDNPAPNIVSPPAPPPPVKKVPLWESERAKRPDLWDKPWECEAYYESPEERKAREKEYFEKELWRRQIISPDPVPPYEAGALKRAVDELGTYEP